MNVKESCDTFSLRPQLIAIGNAVERLGLDVELQQTESDGFMWGVQSLDCSVGENHNGLYFIDGISGLFSFDDMVFFLAVMVRSNAVFGKPGDWSSPAFVILENLKLMRKLDKRYPGQTFVMAPDGKWVTNINGIPITVHVDVDADGHLVANTDGSDIMLEVFEAEVLAQF